MAYNCVESYCKTVKSQKAHYGFSLVSFKMLKDKTKYNVSCLVSVAND